MAKIHISLTAAYTTPYIHVNSFAVDLGDPIIVGGGRNNLYGLLILTYVHYSIHLFTSLMLLNLLFRTKSNASKFCYKYVRTSCTFVAVYTCTCVILYCTFIHVSPCTVHIYVCYPVLYIHMCVTLYCTYICVLPCTIHMCTYVSPCTIHTYVCTYMYHPVLYCLFVCLYITYVCTISGYPEK